MKSRVGLAVAALAFAFLGALSVPVFVAGYRLSANSHLNLISAPALIAVLMAVFGTGTTIFLAWFADRCAASELRQLRQRLETFENIPPAARSALPKISTEWPTPLGPSN
ncbi:MAG TPA: hypothetical protein VL967_15500 [Terracidiphilus sp.]|nr:hypothetical protein [Terracidiphilus sp.]